MTTEATPTPEQRAATETGRVVVGVDLGGRSTSAASWAVREAEQRGSALTLVTAYPPVSRIESRYQTQTSQAEEAEARQQLEQLLRRLNARGVSVDLKVEPGPAQRVILDLAADADLVVLGRRGMGAAHRLVVGSTSMAVAGRSAVPAVVVPEQWVQPIKANAPVVVGVDMPDLGPVAEPPADVDAGVDERVLDFAAERAERLKVPLVVVSAWEIPSMYAWSPDDIAACRHRYDEQLGRIVEPWRTRYPGLEIAVEAVAETPSSAVLDAAGTAQLAVVGRHTAEHHLGGFHLGSTARAVLHHAAVPVVVVPAVGTERGQSG